ncbi:dephospho-CoA kinase [Edaphobacter albus]|uniref:dephospho-CoA kinase n=1 Tax=Edaphobacter sp. 4G125 TaxID=2763071 RepID=UPI0016473C85|nr:dephospho-CoA kinase [Edaphobacter sp. 4G125]QNI36799.1 dephospho-CoA kinase [Edaphobacter sp. 4G125]
MLRVGLTGGLGSGKSTAARLFAQYGAYILEADAIGREMMQPDEAVYAAIVEHFGPAVLREDRQLDRAALARIAFTEGRVEELNAIVHPAVIARQAELAQEIFASDPRAIVVVESALIFETRHTEVKDGESAPWRSRFDCIILVAAAEEVKIERYLQRMAAGAPLTPERRAELTADARSRLSQQIPDARKAELCDFVLVNDGSIAELEEQVDELWPVLQFASVNT